MTDRERSDGCLSELRLDRFVAGEITEEDARDEHAAVTAHLADCARCSERLATRREEQRAFAAAAPALILPTRKPSRPGLRRFAPALGVVAALAAAILIFRRPVPPSSETIMTKGRAQVRYFIRDGVSGAVREGGRHERVHAGDQIRFAFPVAPDVPPYVAVVARDGGGHVSVYLPDVPHASVPPTDADGLTPYSVKLDDTLGPERVYVLFCSDAVALAPIERALARGTTPDWPKSCVVDALTWEKQPRP